MDWFALGIAVGLCMALAGTEGAMSGSDLPRWLASLNRPRFYAPLWVWVLAATMTYAIQGTIAYRLAAS
jgi:tryptophan-rich sensory protein